MSRVTIAIEDMPDGTFNIACHPNWQELVAKHKSGNNLTMAESVALGMMANVKKAVDEYKRTGKFNIVPERKEGRDLIYNLREI